ncbi:uncharacterized protein THITE_2073045 [Thermothielavioides terrestris NRRL 8126]|uniref:U4/U6 snRNA-associated-splicing factor PRP24 n=1 Tax=Thermothielavioides terrestris (strain ATCC 38088 / NRRL 8126) TaxID=578455 RepID=G2QVZ0_THETT|nr:uncharacterized protein THITE_2073045 [Thermothielavioides terrestris NRRL 8126]AEO64722.1 hypothetical protein THITE_2073045 [Thermothielavioides terrestris NRRL 8126]
MANPVGEDNWVEFVDHQLREAADLEGRVRVIEAFRRATLAEPGSLKVWTAYCEYFWSLYTDCQPGSDAGWPPEEQQIGRETFTLDAALNLWQEGYEAVQYRLSDSHELWNRWVSLEMELLRRNVTEPGVRRITHLFKNRLAVPHMTWDATSQMFSSFLSEYNRQAYESEMLQVTRNARDAKRLCDMRDPWETKLARAAKAGDAAALRATMSEYLDWEIRLVKSKKDARDVVVNFQICLGLFSRALTGPLAADEDTWLNFIVLISTSHTELKAGRSPVPARLVPNMLDVLQRAVRHIPWSGPIWARYILTAEEAGLSFTDIERIKHAATDSAQLDREGMASVLDMYSAWCSYLKRSAMNPNATEEAVDVAEVGLPSALEDVKHWGKRKYGDAYQGDPDYRLEKILIQFLTEKKDDIEGARAVWEQLSQVELHANSYDFWLNWYMWEMMVFAANRSKTRSPTPATMAQGLRVPSFATRVFTRALKVRTVDWPERLMEVYLKHCNDYELAETLREAQDTIYKTRKGVAKRRQRESAQAAEAAQAALAAQQQAAQAANAADQPMTDLADANSSPGSKRKREETPGEDVGVSKRSKSETHSEELKRDRENTSVWVSNLPRDATQTKLKQFFREFGHINNIVIQKRDDAAVALVEFRTADDARSALLRDNKYFGDHVVQVTAATDCTLFVTNYPPEADEQYVRDLFKNCGEVFSIRFPSLKYNTKRRFCYVTFRDRDAAAAATKLDGKPLESGKYKLLAKFSDPLARQQRHGAQAEERELHVVNLPRGTSEDDVRGLFAKAGRVVSVRVPRNMAGQSHGTAFVVMETKAEAQEAIRALDKLIFGQHPIKVELSRPPTHKVTATDRTAPADGAAAPPSPQPPHSPARDARSPASSSSEPAPSADTNNPTAAAIAARTVAVLGVPDTVTVARLRAVLAAAPGMPPDSIAKLVLHPTHGGALVELVSEAAAGRAALAWEGLEMPFEGAGDGQGQEQEPGKPQKRRLRTGKPADLSAAAAAAANGTAAQGGGPAAVAGKSNADFKRMFLGGSGSGDAAASTAAATTSATAATATPGEQDGQEAGEGVLRNGSRAD